MPLREIELASQVPELLFSVTWSLGCVRQMQKVWVALRGNIAASSGGWGLDVSKGPHEVALVSCRDLLHNDARILG